MDDNSVLTGLLAGVILFIVGIRLLRIASLTKGRPERLLGIYLGLTGVSYFFYQIPLLMRLDAVTPYTDLTGRLIYGVAVYFILAFTRTVFRGRVAWSRWLVRALMVLLVLGIGGSTLLGDFRGFSLTDPWFWLEWLGYTLATIWVSTEALLAHRNAKKRLRIGLCEPIIANRYLLWSLFGIFQFLGSLAVIYMYYDYAMTQQWRALPDVLLGACEILAAASAWFVFMAPAFYREWIARRARTSNAERS